MSNSFSLLKMSYQQITLLTAQLMVYQQYLLRKVAPSVKRDRALRVLGAFLQRLGTMIQQTNYQTMMLLTNEEVILLKEALIVLQAVLETKPSSTGRDLEIQRLAAMKMVLDQTFPDIQVE